MRTKLTAVTLTLVLFAGSVEAEPAGGSSPVPVSPIAPAGELPAAAERCPTFSWGGVEGSAGYRLQIFEVGDAGPGEILVAVDLPPGRSWTSPTCLDEARTYGWRVRALGPRFGEGPWSELVPFRVADRDSLASALARVAERLRSEGRLTEAQWRRLEERYLTSARSAGPPISFGAGAIPLAPAPPPSPLHAAGNAAVHAAHEGTYGLIAIGNDVGVYAEALDPAAAIAGRATAPSGQTSGVHAVNLTALDAGAPADAVAQGVRGTGVAVGVRGTAVAPAGVGVSGRASSTFAETSGVIGESASKAGIGARGLATGTSNTNYGVHSTAAATGVDYLAAGTGSYGPFTGSHLVRLGEGARGLEPGMVVTVTGAIEAAVDAIGRVHLSATLPTVSLADRPEDPRVLGVYVAEVDAGGLYGWTNAAGERIGAVNALGEGRMWVSDLNGPVAAGDLLTSSALPGYAQRQSDSVVRTHTVGKAIETIDWSRVETTAVHQGRPVKIALVAVVYCAG